MKLDTLADAFARIEKGELANDMGEAMKRVLAACVAIGDAKGEVKLTLKFAVTDNITSIEGEIAEKLPKPKRRKSQFWADEDGNLHTSDPRQINMFERGAQRQPVVIDGGRQSQS